MFSILVTTLIQGPEPRPKTPPPMLKEKFGLFNTSEEAAETLRRSGWDDLGMRWSRNNPKDPEGKDPLAPSWLAEIVDLNKTNPIEMLPGFQPDCNHKNRVRVGETDITDCPDCDTLGLD